MSLFSNPLIVSPLKNGKDWVVRQEFVYEVGEAGSNEKVIVPVGFITDFTSVPRIFWWAVNKWGKHGNAAVVHDYLYQSQTCSRKKSDKIFLEAMLFSDVNIVLAYLMYWSVRLFGWKTWNKFKKYKVRKIKITDDYIQLPVLDF